MATIQAPRISATQPPTLEEIKAQGASIGNELARLKPALDSEERNLSAVTVQYNGACRDLALGKDANPATYKAEMDRRSDKIQGLKSLIADLERQSDQLAPLQRKLELQVILRQEAEELVRLKGVQLEKQTLFEAAQKSLDVAQGERNAANYAVDQYRRQCELRHKRREQGFQ